MVGCAGRSSLHQHHLELGLLRGVARSLVDAREPTFDLLEGNRVLCPALSNFDVQDGCRADFLDPDIGAQPADAVDDGFVQALRLDLDAVTDSSRINEADRARPNRHGERV